MMNYEVKYNRWNGREFANVSFENGSECSFEIFKSKPRTAKEAFRNETTESIRLISGSYPKDMTYRFDGYLTFMDAHNGTFSGIINHRAFGECEVVSSNDQITNVIVMATGEKKSLATKILINFIVK